MRKQNALRTLALCLVLSIVSVPFVAAGRKGGRETDRDARAMTQLVRVQAPLNLQRLLGHRLALFRLLYERTDRFAESPAPFIGLNGLTDGPDPVGEQDDQDDDGSGSSGHSPPSPSECDDGGTDVPGGPVHLTGG